MKESVIYQDILQKGEKKGEQNEAFRFVSSLLNRRFGDLDLLIIERIRVLSTAQLEILGLDLLDFSDASDLETWLNQHS
jgi:predicted transposase YdaD